MNEYHTTNAEYALEDYDPHWKVKFEEMKVMLQGVFGAKALQIEHVGSTSVEGMKAKPVIDALVVVSDMGDISMEKKELEKLGYIYRNDYVAESSLFMCKEEGSRRLENIHIMPEGHERIATFIDKRDYLRAHPEEARRYEEVKHMLNEKFPEDYAAYKAGKEDYLNHELVEKMAAWRREGK